MLEGRHVIGLFMLMLLFSGVFFTLGYVMARNQYDGQVRASDTRGSFGSPDVLPKKEVITRSTSKKPAPEPQTQSTDTAIPASTDWEFYHAGDSNKVDDHLKPIPTTVSSSAPTKNVSASKPAVTSNSSSSAISRTIVPPPLGSGAGINLQVAAMTHEPDAMALANSLRKKNFPTFVQSPQGDKFYHVLVGPYADQKSADAARKGLEAAGFKAIVKH